MKSFAALPAPKAGRIAEIIICQGLPRCDGGDGEPCPFCLRICADDAISEKTIGDSLRRAQ
jgi:hypothetical protein